MKVAISTSKSLICDYPLVRTKPKARKKAVGYRFFVHPSGDQYLKATLEIIFGQVVNGRKEVKDAKKRLEAEPESKWMSDTLEHRERLLAYAEERSHSHYYFEDNYRKRLNFTWQANKDEDGQWEDWYAMRVEDTTLSPEVISVLTAVNKYDPRSFDCSPYEVINVLESHFGAYRVNYGDRCWIIQDSPIEDWVSAKSFMIVD